MAATASSLPLLHKNHYDLATTPTYNEYGLQRSSSAVHSAYDWDEEVVPALRKKLEEDRQFPSRRFDPVEETETPSSYLQAPASLSYRPGIRSKPSAEILQDGLGSDDLIPSEWVTGSSAQFQSFTPRTRAVHLEERRSPLGSPHFNASPSLSQHHNLSPSVSPHSPNFQPQTIPSSSSTNNLQDDVVTARERAQMLVRERSQTLLPSSLISNAADCSGDREDGIARSCSTDGLDPRARSPSIAGKAEGNEGNRDCSRDSSGFKEGQSSQEALRKTPNGASNKEMRRMKSVEAFPGSQHSKEDNARTKSRHIGGVIPTSQTFPRYETTNMHDSHVNDEFGPLGATPKRRLPSGFCEDETARRTSSNPWDEEMLPTVKRRLEQQRMMEELGKHRDEDLVDMWDRNGLPLRKSPVTLKGRSSTRSESINKMSSPHSPTRSVQRGTVDKEGEMMAVEDSSQADLQAEVQAQRLKRLQEQLDMGLFANPAQPQEELSVQELAFAEAQRDENEVSFVDYDGAAIMTKPEEQEQEQSSHTDPIPLTRQTKPVTIERKILQPTSNQRDGSRSAIGEKEMQGGCCSCIVM